MSCEHLHPARRSRLARLPLCALAAALALSIGVATPAGAASKDVDRIRYQGSEQCDNGRLLQHAKGTSTLEITETSADGQAFLAHQFAQITNSFNLRGQRFTVTLDIEYVETSMTKLDADDPRLVGVDYVGPVYEFEAYQLTTVTARTSAGTIVPEYTESDVRTDFLDVFDTLGDFTPGAEFISGESSGPVPAYFDASGCDVAAAAAQV